jgi:hypothetical protein
MYGPSSAAAAARDPDPGGQVGAAVWLAVLDHLAILVTSMLDVTIKGSAKERPAWIDSRMHCSA